MCGLGERIIPLWQFWSHYWAFLLGFLQTVILLCLALSLYLVYLQVLPCVCMYISQPRQILAKSFWWVSLTSPTMVWHSSFLTFNEPFCVFVVRKVSLTSRMRNMFLFSSYLCRAQLLLLLLFWKSIRRGQIPTAQPGDHPSPAIIMISSKYHIPNFVILTVLDTLHLFVFKSSKQFCNI